MKIADNQGRVFPAAFPAGSTAALKHECFDVLGIGVSVINMRSTRAFIKQWLDSRNAGYICVTSVHGICEAVRQPDFKDLLNRACLITPDGMPLVWLGKLSGLGNRIERVYGPDLMLEIMGGDEFANVRHFFYGGKPGVVEKLETECRRRFPKTNIVGTFTPPFHALKEEQQIALFKKVESCRPDIIWVGLSTPKQERFMRDYVAQLNVPLLIGVGAAFDFHSSSVRQAPSWVRNSGFEWAFRFYQEPRRLWRRYTQNIPFFLAKLLLYKRHGSQSLSRHQQT
jgi:N-acetylglucosaminyldiphosphoundecaprenol N-acetyl-beta-D-mannosaminyltransferase